MSSLKRFLTGLLGFFLVAGLYLLPFTIALNSTVLNKNFIVSLLSQLNYPAIIDQTFTAALGNDLPEGLTPESLARLKKELVKVLEENVSIVVSDFYAYLNGENESFSAVIDLSETKQVIKAEMTEAFRQAVPAAEYAKNQASIDQQIEQTWQEMAGQIPDRLDLQAQLERSDAREVLQEIRQGIAVYHKARFGLIIFLIAAFLVIGLLQFKLQPILRTCSIIITIAGVLSLLTDLSLFALYKFGSLALSEVPVQGLELDSLAGAVGGFINILLFAAIIYLVTGIGMQITGNILKGRSTPQQEELDENL